MAEASESCKERFQWKTGDKIANLIQCLATYKSQMEYNNSDFNADKVKQYEAVRKAMAIIYKDNPSYFGPPEITPMTEEARGSEEVKLQIETQQKVDRAMIKKAYNRVQEKLKEIRQNFSTAVTTGSRSGSGKIVLEHFEELKLIWGGSPATKPLSIGISSDMVNNDSTNSSSESVLETEEAYDADWDDNSLALQDADSHSSQVQENQEIETGQSNMRKRKVMENPTPKLIDNKRRHMERQLSAAQRDQLLLNEAKEDAQFKRDIAEAIHQSNQTFAESIQNMSHSIMQVAQGLTRSIEVMSQALVQSNASQYSGHGLDRNQPASGFGSRGTANLYFSSPTSNEYSDQMNYIHQHAKNRQYFGIDAEKTYEEL